VDRIIALKKGRNQGKARKGVRISPHHFERGEEMDGGGRPLTGIRREKGGGEMPLSKKGEEI